MAEFAFQNHLLPLKKRHHPQQYCLCPVCAVLFLGRRADVKYAGTCPGVFEHLMQIRDNSSPRIKIGLAVGTLFGLIPFLFGGLLIGALGLILRWSDNR